ncbi:hypothetical protein IHE45_14G139400 [Dioscorea alata]|uniref:Uncharacterized protein n=1 Tax=Dioscorea alata TaxID=55571 RepID=A0ACB7UVS9_DIOAL|nr:hypothetical protein IHE45_14G139400 [Dioscorea alata]
MRASSLLLLLLLTMTLETVSTSRCTGCAFSSPSPSTPLVSSFDFTTVDASEDMKTEDHAFLEDKLVAREEDYGHVDPTPVMNPGGGGGTIPHAVMPGNV